MWELSFLGIDLYHIAGWFWIYSFLGWIWETSYVSFLDKKFVNRGFVSGPVLTIYGLGAVILYVFLHKLSQKPVILYFSGVIIATLLEYITAVLMEKIFNASWWDYTDKKFNFRGKICLQSSIAWGFFTLLLIYVLHPFVSFIFDALPKTAGELIISLITIIYAVDFGISVIAALNLKDKLKSLDDMREEFAAFLKKLKLTEIVEEFKKPLDSIKRESRVNKIKERFEKTKENLSKRVNKHNSKSEILSRFDLLTKKYIKSRNKLDRTTKRYLKAYPKLKIKRKK